MNNFLPNSSAGDISYTSSLMAQFNPGYHKVVYYKPVLDNFLRIAHNWYTVQCAKLQRDDQRLTNDEFEDYCLKLLGYLNCLHLEQLVLITLSRKIDALKFHKAFASLLFPTFLISLCREVIRPMARGKTFYVPWINCNYDSASIVGSGLGIDPINTSYFQSTLPHVLYSIVMLEQPLVSPVMVCENDYMVIFPYVHITEYRYESMRMLRSFVNGTIIYDEHRSITYRTQPHGRVQPYNAERMNQVPRETFQQSIIYEPVHDYPQVQPAEVITIIKAIALQKVTALNRIGEYNRVFLWYDDDAPTRANILYSWHRRTTHSDFIVTIDSPLLTYHNGNNFPSETAPSKPAVSKPSQPTVSTNHSAVGKPSRPKKQRSNTQSEPASTEPETQ